MATNGFLRIQSEGLIKSWKSRWFYLDVAAKTLKYYEEVSKPDAKPKGTIDLGRLTAVTSIKEKEKEGFGFLLKLDGAKDITLLANTEQERDNWVHGINHMLHPTAPTNNNASTGPKDEDNWWYGLFDILHLHEREQSNALIVTFSGTKLDKKDTFGKSGGCFHGFSNLTDPFLRIFNKTTGTLIGKTEVQRQTLDPQWQPWTLHLSVAGGPSGIITIECYDWDDDGATEFIGSCAVEVRSLVANKTFTLLNKGKSAGTLVITKSISTSLPPPPPYEAIQIQPSVTGFAKLDGPGGKADPFFVLLKHGEVIYRSEVVPKSLDPKWKPFTIDAREIAWNDMVELVFYDYDDDGSWELAGKFQTEFHELFHKGSQFAIVDSNKKSPTYKNSGLFFVDSATFVPPQHEKFVAPAPAYRFRVAARKLDRKDLSGSSDPFFILSVEDISRQILYRSEVIQKNLNPTWKQFDVPVIVPNLAIHKNTKLRIDAFDADKDGGHDWIGGFTFSLKELHWHPSIEYSLNKTSHKSHGAFIFESITALGEPLPLNLHPGYKVTAKITKLKRQGGPLSSADPFFEIKAIPFNSTRSTPLTLYRSEVLHKNLNPEWKPFVLTPDIFGGFFRTLTVIVYDWEKSGNHNIIGEFDTQLWDLTLGGFFYPIAERVESSSYNYLNSKAQRSWLDVLLKGRSSSGAFFLSVESAAPSEIPTLPEAFSIECSGIKLDKKDLGSSGTQCALFANKKKDPYFVIRAQPQGFRHAITLYKSEIIFKNLNPEWKSFTLKVSDVRGLDSEFEITVFDYDKDGTHDLIGTFRTTLREWTFGSYQQALINPEKVGNIGYSSSGAFSVNKLTPTSAAAAVQLPPAYLVKARAQKLPKADVGIGAKSDPFFCIKYHPKMLEKRHPIPAPPGYMVTMYRSEVVQKTINPDWKAFQLSVNLIGGDLDTPFEIQVFDWDSDGTHDLLGSISTTLREWTFSWCELSLSKEDGSGAGNFVIESIQPLGVEEVRSLPVGFLIKTSADKLARTDGPMSKSDPFFVIKHLVPRIHSKPITIHRSEVIKKNLSPSWQPFELSVEDIGGLDEEFQITVFDWDADGGHDEIGSLTTTLREVSFGWFQKGLELDGSPRGSFSIDGMFPIGKVTQKVCPAAFKVGVSAMKLEKKDAGPMGKSDPFFEVKFTPKGYKEITLYRSEVAMKNLNPKWNDFELSMEQIRDLDTEFEIRVYDWDKDGGHDLIGLLKTTAREWTFGSYQQALINPEKVGNIGYESSGAFSVDWVSPLDAAKKKHVPVAYSLGCSAMKLEKKDGPLGKSDPFFEVIARPPGFTKDITIHRSEAIMKNLDPVWKRPFILNVADVHGIDNPFEVRVYDWDKDGSHDLIGRTFVTLRDLSFGPYQMALKHPDKERSSSYQSSGAFSVDWVSPAEAEYRPVTPVAYKVQCRGLAIKSKDLMKKSDPFFVVKAKPPGFTQVITIYRSEVIKTTDEPVWKPFELNVADVHGLDTEFTISVYDWDADGGHDFVGSCTSTLREWTFPGYSMALRQPGKSSSGGGFIIDWVQPLDMAQAKEVAVAYLIRASGMKLEKKDGPLGKSDPFFEVIARPPGFTKDITIHRSNVVKEDLNPVWKEFEISLNDVRGLDTPFTINVYDWDADGGHDLIGSLTTTFREWTFGSYQQGLVNPAKVGNIGYQTSGAFSVDEVLPLNASQQKVYSPAYYVYPSGLKLAKKDLMSKSDPFFRVTAQPPGFPFPVTLYRSEVIKNDKSPAWKPFILNLRDVQGLDTEFTVAVYDWDEDGGHDLIGSMTTTFREWTFDDFSKGVKSNPNSSSTSGAFCVSRVEHVWMENYQWYSPAYTIEASANKLVSSKLLDKTNPFFKITAIPAGFWYPITLYRSEVIDESTKPKWKPFVLNLDDVRGLDSEFIISVYDWRRDGNHELIGESRATFREWTFGPYQQALVNPKRSGSSGAFSVDSISGLGGRTWKTFSPAYKLKTSAAKLARKDLLGTKKSDSFFKITATPANLPYPITIYRSEVLKETADPTWLEFNLNLDDIRGVDTEFTISVYDWDADGGHDLIGTAKTTFRELTFGSYQMALLNSNKSGSSGAFSVDEIVPLEAKEVKTYSIAYRVEASGMKLAKQDLMTKSDPFFKITATPAGFNYPITLYRSEVVKNESNPNWSAFTLNLEDIRGLDTEFTISVYDWDADGGHDLIGTAKTTFREWTFGSYQIAVYHPNKSGSRGAFSINSVTPLSAKEVKTYSPAYQVTPAGMKLAKKDLMGKSDPFFKITATPAGFNYPITLYRSEVIKQTTEPQWKPFTLNLEDIRGLDTEFTIYVYDWDKDGGHELIGTTKTTFREWTFGPYQIGLFNGGSKSQGAFSVNAITGLDIKEVKTYAPAYKITASAAKLASGIKSPDPFFVVKATPPGFTREITLHRSEHNPTTTEPKWNSFSINIDDVKGLDTEFTVYVYDWDKDGGHDLVGQLRTTFREWTFGSYQQALTLSGKSSSQGAFSVDLAEPLPAKETRTHTPAYEVLLSGDKLARQDLIGGADPYFEIFSLASGVPVKLYRSEVVKKTLSPKWKSFKINTLDVGGLDTDFLVQCWDWNEKGGQDLIGEFKTTLREWLFAPFRFALRKSKSSSSSGAIVLESVTPLSEHQSKLSDKPAYKITLAARKLDKKDGIAIGGSSDPFFRIIATPKGSLESRLAYKSEHIEKSLDPTWKSFVLNVDDLGGLDATIEVAVYDWDPDGGHDCIGSCRTQLRDWTFQWFETALLNGSKSGGALIVQSIEGLAQSQPAQYSAAYTVKASGARIAKTDFLSKSDPFFEIKRKFAGFSEPLTIYRSEVIKDSSTPDWKAFNLSMVDVGGLDSPFTIIAWDYDVDGNHNLIGKFDTTFREWTFGSTQQALVNPAKLGRLGYETSGAFSLDRLTPTSEGQIRILAPAYKVHIKAQKLESKDTLGKSDPFFVVQKSYPGMSAPITLYRSEHVKQDLNPNWKPFEISSEWVGGFDSPFTITCYDWNEHGDHEEIGSFSTTLREWTFGSFTHALINTKKAGRIGYSSSGGFIVDKLEPLEVAQLKVYAPAYSIKAQAVGLERKDILGLGKSDPFFIVRCIPPGWNQEITLYRSETVKNNSNADWIAFTVSSAWVGGLDKEFKIYVYDWDEDGGHDVIGIAVTTLRDLTFGPIHLPVVNPDKKGRIGYRSSGAFYITQVKDLPQDQVPTYAPAYKIFPGARKLARMDGPLKKTDPFFEILRHFPGFPEPIVLYRSEYISQTLEALWKPFELSMSMIETIDTPFIVRVYDWNADGFHDEVGEVVTTLREWTFAAPFSGAIVSPSQRGRSDYKSSGAFHIVKLEPLKAENINPIPLAYHIATGAQKLDKCNYPYFEVTAVYNGLKQVIYRSEKSGMPEKPEWKPFILPVIWACGLDSPIKIKVFDWKSDTKPVHIGTMKCTLREWTFGEYQMPLINNKKAKRVPRYRSSGAFSILKLEPINKPNFFHPATAFKVMTRLMDFTAGKGSTHPKFDTLSVYGRPLGAKKDVLLYRDRFTNKDAYTWEFVLPFSSTSGIDVPLTFKLGSGLFKATLRELAFPSPTFSFRKDKTKMFKRNYTGMLEVLSCQRMVHYTKAIQFTAACSQLDAKDGIGQKSDPFMHVSLLNADGTKSILYTSETQFQTLEPAFQPFIIDLVAVGGMDANKILFDIWDYDQSGNHDFIGSFSATPRELSTSPSFNFINDYKKHNLTEYVHSGILRFTNIAYLPSAEPLPEPFALQVDCLE